MRQLLARCKQAVKWFLRPLADALLASSSTLPERMEDHLAGSPALVECVEQQLAGSAVLPARVEEIVRDSELLPGRVEECLAVSEALPSRVEECLAASESLPGRVEDLLAQSEALASQVESALAQSHALGERIEETLASSEVVPARVEDGVLHSEVLPRRIEECVSSLRSLADRIEECLWNSKALPRRIDEHLAGSKALPDVLIEECLKRSAALPRLLTDLLPDNPCLAGVLLPYRAAFPWSVPRSPAAREPECGPDGLPLPPPDLWEGHGPSAVEYLASGREPVATLRRLLAVAGPPVESARHILDFTCGAGRALRWLTDLAPRCELWGTDMSAPHVVWMRHALCPPLRAVTRSTYPHLPFEDQAFDMIYSLVPFGRPPDLADAWLLELKRVLRPGGRLHLCVLDKQAVARLLDPARLPSAGPEAVLRAALKAEPLQELLHSDYSVLALPTPLGVHVLYDDDYPREHWGRELRLLSEAPAACGALTALLWERP